MRWNLKVKLMQAGIPAWRIAQEIGIRPDLLSKITSGAADPSTEVRERLCDYFDSPESELFEDSPTETRQEPRPARRSRAR